MTTDTGGPAFPCDLAAYDPEVRKDMQGMELRDYFAAKALIKRGFTVRPYDDTDQVAKDCYRMADAMMKARNGTA